MRALPPYLQEVQSNEQLFDDYVPEFVDPTTGEPLPSASYRLRWNTRTESWECDWFDSNGEPIDQGRRLSADWYLRTPWQNGDLPDPMPGWISFLNAGTTGEEADYEALGRSHQLIELNNDDLQDIQDSQPPLYPFDVTITIP
jgi:hypothetical protein